jgi:CRP-like cAMP-binding protein
MVDPQTARRNRLCAQLPPEALEALLAPARVVDIPLGQTLIERDTSVTTGWFPLSGMASMMATDPAGSMVEVATIGREGVVGAVGLADDGTLPFEVTWQLPGAALAIGLPELHQVAASYPALERALVRYTNALLAQAGQNGGCNRLHGLEQRAAKWLLLTLDRAEGETFPLTQEFLSIMLGVTRPKVSEAAQGLAEDGLIAYRRGAVTVLDRTGLAARSCDCYRAIRSVHERLGVRSGGDGVSSG